MRTIKISYTTGFQSNDMSMPLLARPLSNIWIPCDHVHSLIHTLLNSLQVDSHPSFSMTRELANPSSKVVEKPQSHRYFHELHSFP